MELPGNVLIFGCPHGPAKYFNFITNLGGDLEYSALQPGVEFGRRVLQVVHTGLLGLAAPAG